MPHLEVQIRISVTPHHWLRPAICYLDGDDVDTITSNGGNDTYVDGGAVAKWVKADATDPSLGDRVNSGFHLGARHLAVLEAIWNATPGLDRDRKDRFQVDRNGEAERSLSNITFGNTPVGGELTSATIGNAADSRYPPDFFGDRNLQFGPRPVIRLSGCAAVAIVEEWRCGTYGALRLRLNDDQWVAAPCQR